MPRWNVYLLMKWTFLHGGYKIPSKELTERQFIKILNSIQNFNQEHITQFIKGHKFMESFLILHTQQFYLQSTFYKDKMASHLKLFHSIKHKYDLDAGLQKNYGLTVLEFKLLLYALFLYCNSNDIEGVKLKFFGFINPDFLEIGEHLSSKEKTIKFLKHLCFDPNWTEEEIRKKTTFIRKAELQQYEKTFFTLYPLQIYQDRIRLIDGSILDYSVNYYLHDFLRIYDPRFPEEFGHRFEKYVGESLDELECSFVGENELKTSLPKDSKVVDFHIPDDNIFIECKAIEIQPYIAINPTDELLYSSLKGSILKAYFEQLHQVSKHINGDGENWGVILTYKEIFISHMPQIFDLGKGKFDSWNDTKHIPPENVFIIDLATWDKIIAIIKSGQITLIELLRKGRGMNSEPETKRQSFYMFLDDFKFGKSLGLSYLKEEIEIIDKAFTSNR